jgi:hypothetical protein
MRLLGQPVHCLRHAVEEEGLGLLLASVTVGRRDQFLALGTASVANRSGKTGLQRTTQPDVEEVRQVCVADVVVVGRIGGDDLVGRAPCVVTASACALAPAPSYRKVQQALLYRSQSKFPSQLPAEPEKGFASGVVPPSVMPVEQTCCAKRIHLIAPSHHAAPSDLKSRLSSYPKPKYTLTASA